MDPSGGSPRTCSTVPSCHSTRVVPSGPGARVATRPQPGASQVLVGLVMQARRSSRAAGVHGMVPSGAASPPDRGSRATEDVERLRSGNEEARSYAGL